MTIELRKEDINEARLLAFAEKIRNICNEISLLMTKTEIEQHIEDFDFEFKRIAGRVQSYYWNEADNETRLKFYFCYRWIIWRAQRDDSSVTEMLFDETKMPPEAIEYIHGVNEGIPYKHIPNKYNKFMALVAVEKDPVPFWAEEACDNNYLK